MIPSRFLSTRRRDRRSSRLTLSPLFFILIPYSQQYTNNKPWISAVINNPYSDWNLLPFPASSSAISPTPFTSFKVSRAGTFVRIYAKLPEDGWTMIREVTNFLKDGEKVFIGIMGCSPKGIGVKVEFEDLWVE